MNRFTDKSQGNNAQKAGKPTPSAKRGNTPNAGRKGTKRPRTRITKPLNIMKLVFATLALALCVVFVIHFFFSKPPETDTQAYVDDGTFFEGITINGRDVSGLSYNEAYTMLLPHVENGLHSINITVVHSTTLWVLTAADLNITTNFEAVLTEAILLGRNDTRVHNTETQKRLKEEGQSFTIDYIPDTQALSSKLHEIGELVNTDPIEPYAVADTASSEPAFNYFEGKDGSILDETALAAEIANLLAAGTLQTSITPQLQFAAPLTTIDDIKSVTQLRSSFQTSFGGSRAARNEKRVGNIQKATTMLNGAAFQIGEEFSFNGYIGVRTEKDGWPLAPGIVSGDRYEDQPGGGICQVSTTLYNALLCAGPELEITERHHHSWPSSYADTGLDATVTGSVESGKSLNFVNNTGSTVYIFAYCDQENYLMTVYIYGEPLENGLSYEVRGVIDEVLKPEEEPLIVEKPEWPTGYEVVDAVARDGYLATAYRDTYINGELQSTERLYQDRYRAVTKKISRGTGDPSLPKPTS